MHVRYAWAKSLMRLCPRGCRRAGDFAHPTSQDVDGWDKPGHDRLRNCAHQEEPPMLTLYYAPGACSMASHIVLEESGEKYTPQRVDLAKGEQKTEAY